MSEQTTRRTFLAEGSAAVVGGAMSLSAAGSLAIAADKKSETVFAKGVGFPSTSKQRPILKSLKIGMVRLPGTLTEQFKVVKSLGYDGIELNSPSPLKRDDVLRARDESGLPVHGVVDSVHWRETLSDPNPAVRQKGVDGLLTALRDSKAYGGTSVLLVPAVVNKQVSYADAYKRSQAEIRKALPLAGELGIRILFENVWNNFLLSPLEMARYIDEFESNLVGAYFDVGNVVRYGWPEQWVRTLGKRIGKLDIKEYSRKIESTRGPSAGFSAEIGDGDCDWPAVMKALGEIGYQGWGTAEVGGGGKDRLKKISERMDKVFGYRS